MSVDLDKLTQPFPREAIKQRRSGGGTLDYVEGHSVIHRLNDATGNCWSMEVKDITSKDITGTDNRGQQVTNTLMIARVALTIPNHGTREGLGVQMVHERGGEDLVKGCITDALKKAATLFGVGLELYGPDYEAGEVAPVSQPGRPQPRDSAPPPARTPADLRAASQVARQHMQDRIEEGDIDGAIVSCAVGVITQEMANVRERPRQAIDPDDDATQEQLADIGALMQALNMTPPHRKNFARKHVRVDTTEGLTYAQAGTLIRELQKKQDADVQPPMPLEREVG